MPALGALLIGGGIAVCLAILIWAPRYQPCPACGKRVRVDASACACGHAFRTEAEVVSPRDRLVSMLGEDRLARVERWVAAAHVDSDSLTPTGWFVLASAQDAIRLRRLDLVRGLVDGLQLLAPSSRARLIQSAEGSVVIADALDGQLVLREVGYEAATRTFELTGRFEPVVSSAQAEPHLASLRTLVTDHRDGDGNPVDTVRVVFAAAELARRAAAGPLHDAGAKIFYYDDRGELIELNT